MLISLWMFLSIIMSFSRVTLVWKFLNLSKWLVKFNYVHLKHKVTCFSLLAFLYIFIYIFHMFFSYFFFNLQVFHKKKFFKIKKKINSFTTSVTDCGLIYSLYNEFLHGQSSGRTEQHFCLCYSIYYYVTQSLYFHSIMLEKSHCIEATPLCWACGIQRLPAELRSHPGSA